MNLAQHPTQCKPERKEEAEAKKADFRLKFLKFQAVALPLTKTV